MFFRRVMWTVVTSVLLTDVVTIPWAYGHAIRNRDYSYGLVFLLIPSFVMGILCFVCTAVANVWWSYRSPRDKETNLIGEEGTPMWRIRAWCVSLGCLDRDIETRRDRDLIEEGDL